MPGGHGAITLGVGTYPKKQVPTRTGLIGEPGTYQLEMLIASHCGATLMICLVSPLAAAGASYGCAGPVVMLL